MFDLLDLQEPDGSDNTPGIRSDLYVAPENEFKTLKGPKTTNGPTDEVTIDGSHEFEPGKGFTNVYATLDSSEFNLESVGERDGRGFKGTMTFFHPGTKKEAAVFAKRVKNKSSIMIVPLADGTKLQLGTKGLGCEIMPAFASGKLSGGRRGFTFTAEYYTSSLYFYEGEIVEKTGNVVPAG